jgi:hypothetical protein
LEIRIAKYEIRSAAARLPSLYGPQSLDRVNQFAGPMAEDIAHGQFELLSNSLTFLLRFRGTDQPAIHGKTDDRARLHHAGHGLIEPFDFSQ